MVICIEMLPSLDNFVSYGTEVLKARPDYRQKVLDMYRTALTSPQLGDNDKINGCKLAESMLLNLHGHVDDVCLRIQFLICNFLCLCSACKTLLR